MNRPVYLLRYAERTGHVVELHLAHRQAAAVARFFVASGFATTASLVRVDARRRERVASQISAASRPLPILVDAPFSRGRGAALSHPSASESAR